jgi:hypothetical protein
MRQCAISGRPLSLFLPPLPDIRVIIPPMLPNRPTDESISGLEP